MYKGILYNYTLVHSCMHTYMRIGMHIYMNSYSRIYGIYTKRIHNVYCTVFTHIMYILCACYVYITYKISLCKYKCILCICYVICVHIMYILCVCIYMYMYTRDPGIFPPPCNANTTTPKPTRWIGACTHTRRQVNTTSPEASIRTSVRNDNQCLQELQHQQQQCKKAKPPKKVIFFQWRNSAVSLQCAQEKKNSGGVGDPSARVVSVIQAPWWRR